MIYNGAVDFLYAIIGETGRERLFFSEISYLKMNQKVRIKNFAQLIVLELEINYSNFKISDQILF